MLRWLREGSVRVFVAAMLLAVGLGILFLLHPMVWPWLRPQPAPVRLSRKAVVVPPASPTIKYFGRWDMHDSLTYTSYWGGAYLKSDFTGRHIQMKLAAPTAIYVSIDDGADVHYDAQAGILDLTETPLFAGQHTLRVAVGAESASIPFQGLILDPLARSLMPHVAPLTVEFIGDSITAGYSDTMGDLSSYAWLTGEKLDVEHTQIASTGICLLAVVTMPPCAGMQTQFFKQQPPEAADAPWWDDKRSQPNAIVINLGTNDHGHNQLDDSFELAYVSFIQSLRLHYPNTPICVMRTLAGYMEAPTKAAVLLLNASGYRGIYYIDTTGWLTPATSDFNDQFHPSDDGQRKVAEHLAEILQPILQTI